MCWHFHSGVCLLDCLLHNNVTRMCFTKFGAMISAESVKRSSFFHHRKEKTSNQRLNLLPHPTPIHSIISPYLKYYLLIVVFLSCSWECVSALHTFTKKQGKMYCTEQQHVQHVAGSHAMTWRGEAREATLTSTYIQTKAAQLGEWGVSAEVCGVRRPRRVRAEHWKEREFDGCGLRGEGGRSAGRLRECDGCSRSEGGEVRRGHVRATQENSSGELFGF